MSVELLDVNLFNLTSHLNDPEESHWLDWYVDQWTTDWVVEGSTPARTAAKTVAWVALKLFALVLGTVIPVMPLISFMRSTESRVPSVAAQNLDDSPRSPPLLGDAKRSLSGSISGDGEADWGPLTPPTLNSSGRDTRSTSSLASSFSSSSFSGGATSSLDDEADWGPSTLNSSGCVTRSTSSLASSFSSSSFSGGATSSLFGSTSHGSGTDGDLVFVDGTTSSKSSDPSSFSSDSIDGEQEATSSSTAAPSTAGVQVLVTPGQRMLKALGWEILETLGKGAYGEVKKVKDPKGKLYAFKEIFPEKFEGEIKRYFIVNKDRGEALAAQLPEHRNLLQTSMFMVYEKNEYRVVDNLEGIQGHVVGTLAEVIQNKPQELFTKIVSEGSLSEGDLKKFGKALAGALACMHQAGYVHRDLKPENILVNADGELKLIDFTFLRALKEAERTTTMCGTPFYISPELITQKGYGHEAEVWSYGINLFIMAFGFPPFYAESGDFRTLYKEIFAFRDSPLSFENYIKKNIRFEGHPLYHHQELWDLLNKLITSQPEDRITMQEALEHPFFGEGSAAASSSSAR